MPDVFAQLDDASFKGVGFPIGTADFGFQHETAQHKFIFRDEALIQQLGRTNNTWRWMIPLFDNLRIETNNSVYEFLYSAVFPELLAACQDREPGILVTPDLGQVRAACVSFSYVMDPTMRDGVYVTLELIASPEDADTLLIANIPTIETVSSEAADLDDQVAELPDDDAFIEFKEGSFQDPLVALRSPFDQLSKSRDKVFAQFEGTTRKIDNLINSIDRAGNPQNWTARRQANNLKNSLTKARKNSDSQGRKIRSVYLRQTYTPNGLAATLNTSLADLYKLNPGLSRSPTIPRNIAVRYYLDPGQKPPRI